MQEEIIIFLPDYFLKNITNSFFLRLLEGVLNTRTQAVFLCLDRMSSTLSIALLSVAMSCA
jgi:hypothetical protein